VTVNIAPSVGTYGMFANYNYSAWLALAEFLDNSVSSFQKHHDHLKRLHGEKFQLRLSVSYDNQAGTLEIRDNAAGISNGDWQRAFSLAKPPDDLRFIGRFGVGMKAAALWFGKEFTVRTTALGEPFEKTLVWDNEIVVREEPTELHETTKEVDVNDHYTVITIRRLQKPPKTATVTKIKSFLPNIYREFINQGLVRLFWNEEELKFEEPPVLVAPPHWSQDEPAIRWDRQVTLSMDSGVQIRGRIFLLERYRRKFTALNLFWHNRLIKGNIDPNYRPEELFGGPQSERTGRLCVDLHLNDYEPTVDKQGFQFQDDELQEIIEVLKQEAPDMLRQATDYRNPRPAVEDIPQTEPIATAAEAILVSPEPATAENPYPPPNTSADPVANQEVVPIQSLELPLGNQLWRIQLQLGTRIDDTSFVQINEPDGWDHEQVSASDRETRPVKQLTITLGMQHPYVNRHWGNDEAAKAILLHLAAALGYGEISARRAGAERVTFVRNNMDAFLRNIARNLQSGASR